MNRRFEFLSRLLFVLVSVCLAALGTASVAGLLGAWSTFADAFSHFRLHMGLAGLVLAGLAIATAGFSSGWPAAAAGLLIAIVNVASALPIERARPAMPLDGAARLKILTINVLYHVQNDDQIVAQIEAEQPDVILLQEVTRARASLLRRLEAAYPWQVHCPEGAWGDERWSCDVAVVSRHPWLTASAQPVGRDGAKMAVARFGAERGDLLVASIHLKWPLVSDQAAQLAAVGDAIAGHDGPIVVGGDLNAAPWSGAVRGFVRESHLRPAAGFTPTWPRRTSVNGMRCALCVPQLQIDHIFVSEQIRVRGVRTGNDVGSDHLPLIADLDLPSHVTQVATTAR